MKRFLSFLLLVAAMAQTSTVRAQLINGDLNYNKELDVEDITLLINGYLTGEKKYGSGSNTEYGHRFVDLGLSVVWAETNIGADKPNDYGDYFAWGETEPKDSYSWKNYKWSEGTSSTLTKYNEFAFINGDDSKLFLEPEDDAAHVNWGGSWRMPTPQELDELLERCTWKGLTPGGFIVEGPNGNSIVLPAGGFYEDRGYFNVDNARGRYWTNRRGLTITSGYGLSFYGWSNTRRDSPDRYMGFNIRPVCQPPFINGDLNHNGDLDVEDITLLISDYLTGAAECIEVPHEAVDLGLSVKWATMNVGATSPEDYGEYFAWGETQPKDTYDWDTYQWGTEIQLSKYNRNSSTGIVDDKTTLDPEDDVASVRWGDTWRMPTFEEVNELQKNCTWTWITRNGVEGYIVKGPNGRSIFLPSSHSYYDDYFDRTVSYAEYWTSSLGGFDSSKAYYLTLWSNTIDWRTVGRCYGLCVRPVCP
ncbi:MAG: hypothetical protein IJT97_03805 [Bacteroidaceae bacterium]|nr:hypothetical protein [Bacteroidaceae bacterium]